MGWFHARSLLKKALRCGVDVAAFWKMTPAETYMAIEAAVWRDDREQKLALRTAWHTAALSRAKRMPSLGQFMTPPARKVTGEELRKRRQEFDEMTANVDVDQLAGRLKAK